MAPKASMKLKGKATNKAGMKSKVKKEAVARVQSARAVKRISSAHFAQAPKGSGKPRVAYIAIAKRYEEFPATRQGWAKMKFWSGTKRLRMAGRFNIKVLGAFSSTSAAEKCLKQRFPGAWSKRKDDLEQRMGWDYFGQESDEDDTEGKHVADKKNNLSWKHETLLSVEAHEVVGPELTIPHWCSKREKLILSRLWVARGTHTAECADAFSIVANSRILGCFCSLHGSRGANSYVTGAAISDMSDNEAWCWIDEPELEAGITHEMNGCAHLELEADPGDGPSLTTEVCLESVPFSK